MTKCFEFYSKCNKTSGFVQASDFSVAIDAPEITSVFLYDTLCTSSLKMWFPFLIPTIPQFTSLCTVDWSISSPQMYEDHKFHVLLEAFCFWSLEAQSRSPGIRFDLWKQHLCLQFQLCLRRQKNHSELNVSLPKKTTCFLLISGIQFYQ